MTKGLFLGGLVLMSLFAVGHLAGFVQAARAARNDPRMADLTRAMRDHRIDLFGFRPSILDFREYFSLNFSILLVLAVVIGFVALGTAADPVQAIRRLSIAYTLGMLLLLGTSIYFSVLQGIVTCLVIGLLFGLAWWLA